MRDFNKFLFLTPTITTTTTNTTTTMPTTPTKSTKSDRKPVEQRAVEDAAAQLEVVQAAMRRQGRQRRRRR